MVVTGSCPRVGIRGHLPGKGCGAVHGTEGTHQDAVTVGGGGTLSGRPCMGAGTSGFNPSSTADCVEGNISFEKYFRVLRLVGFEWLDSETACDLPKIHIISC